MGKRAYLMTRFVTFFNTLYPMTNIITVAEVAETFFPDSSTPNALRRFRYMLKTDPELWQALTEARYRSHQRVLTPRQYAIIVRFLGDPLA